MPVEQRFIPFNFFLFFRMWLASLRLVNLIMTFLDLLLFNQWQSSIYERLIVKSNLSKSLRVVSSRSSLLILSRTPVFSKHSRLEYWLSPQHYLSNSTTRSCNLPFIFFETDNYDSLFLKSLQSSLRSLLILDKVLPNFAWYSKVNDITSSFVSFL